VDWHDGAINEEWRLHMVQLHKRFSDEQVRVLLQGYCQGLLSAAAVQDYLDIGRSRFFSLVSEYREDPDGFSIAYKRPTPGRLGDGVEAEIEHELLRERDIVEDKRLPISGYNYSALRDRLRKKGIEVALNTIIDRAKRLGCYKPRKKRKVHDREVLTAATGALIQHDSSYHLWSPFAKEKWYLVTSIDDFSRMLLFADFFPKETTWAHIQAVQALTQAYGIPLRYYVDSLRVFRFVQGRDSFWRRHVLKTDDVDTQWRKMMRVLGIDVRNALSPQAKGKIERPYRWLQDRIVRTCALEKISDLDDVRSILRDELDRYNNLQVHSTTKEIPSIRFAKAKKEGSSVFRPFSIPKPYTSTKDVFCLRETRVVDGYRRISLFNHTIEVPNVPLREDVDIHMVPDADRNVMELRVWWNQQMIHSVCLPMDGFGVQF
jgi:GNAT superfamily N-acetyltransferase